MCGICTGVTDDAYSRKTAASQRRLRKVNTFLLAKILLRDVRHILPINFYFCYHHMYRKRHHSRLNMVSVYEEYILFSPNSISVEDIVASLVRPPVSPSIYPSVRRCITHSCWGYFSATTFFLKWMELHSESGYLRNFQRVEFLKELLSLCFSCRKHLCPGYFSVASALK